MIKYIKIFCWFALAGILFSFQTEKASIGISVVVGKNVDIKISEDDVKAFFSANKFKYSDGTDVHIADQPNAEISTKFYEKLLGQSKTKIAQRWMKLVLSGQATSPGKYKSDDEVKKAIAENPGMIGYIQTSSLDDSVKEILKLE